ncbi:hypothetical protein EIN_228350 [Entamoeba invadens IP1]|uniref:Auxin efflux carrier family protein n=1 Tax=Entamoeba invadens IP1 TaxID=370355 RepID=A0A0A1U2U2_ENTIV|nr:hypothetical protein EIN_228350 [Entamoeba invadens IP1]ELP88372.1 hypothetical protein EIN_228350 [Entamoeba invadens IP1]|eukprot:XP_004255143.1 hypothetical protein EIN_228350 [Entamoeba invadens IP1]
MELLSIFVSTFNSIFKLAFVVFAGYIATRTAGFSSDARKVFSTVIFQFLIPALVLSQTATSVDRINTLIDWWYLPLCAIMINVINFSCTYAISRIFRLEQNVRRVFVYSVAFGNMMYIPLALVDSMTSESSIFGENANERGGAYICTFILMSTLIYWVFGYSYIQKNQSDDENVLDSMKTDEKGVEMKSEMTRIVISGDPTPLLVTTNISNSANSTTSFDISSEDDVDQKRVEEEPLISQKDEQKEMKLPTKNVCVVNEKPTPNSSISTQPTKDLNEKEKMISINNLKKVLKFVTIPFLWISKMYTDKVPLVVRRGINNLCTPPTLATLFGIVLVVLYPVRDFIFVNGPISIVGRSIKYLGGAAVVCALFVLGGNLSSGPKAGNIKWYVIVIGLFVRMVIVPALCIGINFGMWYFKMIPSDPLFFFVVCVESMTPPALNSTIVMNIVYPKGNSECSSLLFWAYLFSTITLSLWMVVTLSLITFMA